MTTRHNWRTADALIRRSLAGEEVELLGDWPGTCAALLKLADCALQDVDGVPGTVRYEGTHDGRPWAVTSRPPSIRGKRGRPKGSALVPVALRISVEGAALLERLQAPTRDRSRKRTQAATVEAGLRALAQAEGLKA